MIQNVLSSKVFAHRREQLFALLPDNSVAMIYSGAEKARNADTHYPFRTDSSFWYLTGFDEDEAIAILHKKSGKLRYVLLSKERDPLKELWTGRIIGQERALSAYGADEAYTLAQSEKILPLLKDMQVYVPQRQKDVFLNHPHFAPFITEHDLSPMVDEMRLIKSQEELAVLKRACEISAYGHKQAMLAAKAGAYEYSVQAELEAAFRREAGCHWSFASIVASGANACCLHYQDNNAPLKAGDLLLVDAGAEYGGYAGDITRTYPISGRFSPEQQAVYEIVLAAQKNAIANAKIGVRHRELHQQTCEILIQGLLDLGIIQGEVNEWIESQAHKQFYPHNTGHWLGLDVHDVGAYEQEGQSRMYQEGMVITIEPGLYLQAYDETIAPKWRGIGIRIEDDVYIGAQGGVVLSGDVPKEVDALTQFLASRN